MSSPTERTLAWLRKDGYTAGVVEQFNSHVGPFGQRFDFLGCIDIIAVRPGETLAIQATSGSNASKRREKAIAEPRLRAWLEAGNAFAVVDWAKRGPRGKRKLWTPRVQIVTIADLPEITAPEPV